MTSQVRSILLPALAAVAPAAYHLYSPAAQTGGRVTNVPSLLPVGYGYILLMLLSTSTVVSIAARRPSTSSSPYSSTFNYALPTLLAGLFWPKLALALASAQFSGIILTLLFAPSAAAPSGAAVEKGAVQTQGGASLAVAKSIEAAALLGEWEPPTYLGFFQLPDWLNAMLCRPDRVSCDSGTASRTGPRIEARRRCTFHPSRL
ncbi:hypothetical protein FA10DRAFT_268752, partial [Acaromyces ingoldii]